MVQSACCYDHAICKDPGSSPTYDQWFFLLKRGFSTQQSNPNANICVMCPNYLACKLSGAHVKQQQNVEYCQDDSWMDRGVLPTPHPHPVSITQPLPSQFVRVDSATRCFTNFHSLCTLNTCYQQIIYSHITRLCTIYSHSTRVYHIQPHYKTVYPTYPDENCILRISNSILPSRNVDKRKLFGTRTSPDHTLNLQQMTTNGHQ